MKKSIKLPLSDEERQLIRKARLTIKMLAQITPQSLHENTGIPLSRCQKLTTLSQFQCLGSIGPNAAEDLWDLNYRSVEELKGQNPREMYERLGGPHCLHDPCVEDVFRCAVAQATYPDLADELRQWWSWMDQRGEPAVRLPQNAETA